MVPESVDVAILGGGPAGTAAALTLLLHTPLTVAVFERSRYDRWRPGETLGEGAGRALRYLGATEAFSDGVLLPAPPARASWGDDRVATRYFPVPGLGTGWHLDRRRFDQALAALVTSQGGSVFVDAAVAVDREAVTREGGGWVVTLLRSDCGSGSLAARFVIDATGPAAVLAHREGATWRVDDRLTGSVAVYTTPPGASLGPTLVEAVADGWWYSSPVPGDRMVVAYMTDPDLLPGRGRGDAHGWEDLLAATRHTRQRVVGDLVLGPHRRPAYSRLLGPVGGAGWVATGDAAVGFDPLSSMGIGYALTSGIASARVAHAALGGHPDRLDGYARAISGHYADYRRRQADYYLVERRWRDSPFWARRHARAGPALSSAHGDVPAGGDHDRVARGG